MEEKIKTRHNDLDVMADYLIDLIVKEMEPEFKSDVKRKLDREGLNLDEKELSRFLIEKFKEDPTNKKEIHDALWEFCLSIMSSINPRMGSLFCQSDGYWDLKEKEAKNHIAEIERATNSHFIPANKK